jgi:lysozyme
MGSHKSYLDSEGLLTGGIGHLMTKEEQAQYPEGTKIPEEVVQAWFEEDLAEAEKDAEILLKGVDVPDEVKSIITNMAFNLGRTRLSKFKKMFSAIEVGDYETAAKEMEDSRWFNQVGGRARRLVSRMAGVDG